jgi:hypothetical protein
LLGAIIGHPIRAEVEWPIVVETGVAALALCASSLEPPRRAFAGECAGQICRGAAIIERP